MNLCINQKQLLISQKRKPGKDGTHGERTKHNHYNIHVKTQPKLIKFPHPTTKLTKKLNTTIGKQLQTAKKLGKIM